MIWDDLKPYQKLLCEGIFFRWNYMLSDLSKEHCPLITNNAHLSSFRDLMHEAILYNKYLRNNPRIECVEPFMRIISGREEIYDPLNRKNYHFIDLIEVYYTDEPDQKPNIFQSDIKNKIEVIESKMKVLERIEVKLKTMEQFQAQILDKLVIFTDMIDDIQSILSSNARPNSKSNPDSLLDTSLITIPTPAYNGL